MGLLDDIWNGINGIGRGIMNIVGSIFRTAASGIQAAFNAVVNFVKSVINWTWKGFDAIYRGLQGAVGALGNVIRNAWEWFVSQLRMLWQLLLNTMNELFKVTEDIIMKYARWQASCQLQLEREMLGGCGGGI